MRNALLKLKYISKERKDMLSMEFSVNEFVCTTRDLGTRLCWTKWSRWATEMAEKLAQWSAQEKGTNYTSFAQCIYLSLCLYF